DSRKASTRVLAPRIGTVNQSAMVGRDSVASSPDIHRAEEIPELDRISLCEAHLARLQKHCSNSRAELENAHALHQIFRFLDSALGRVRSCFCGGWQSADLSRRE